MDLKTEKPTNLDKQPTIKQLIAFKTLSEIIRNKGSRKNITLGSILRKAGYSEEVSLKPKLVTGTQGFKSLFKQYISDEFKVKKHYNLMGAATLQHYIFPSTMSDEDMEAVIKQIPEAKLINIKRNQQWARVYFLAPDLRLQKDMLELTYKVDGNLNAK